MQGVYRSLASIIFITYIVVAIIHKLIILQFLEKLFDMNQLQIMHIKIMTQRQSGPSGEGILLLGLHVPVVGRV